jgi:hypothetical protein
MAACNDVDGLDGKEATHKLVDRIPSCSQGMHSSDGLVRGVLDLLVFPHCMLQINLSIESCASASVRRAYDGGSRQMYKKLSGCEQFNANHEMGVVSGGVMP